MALRVYNTLSRQKEEFETLEPHVVKMYVCGPTVYDDAHIGHAMSSLVFDIIKRYLIFKGYDVRHVMNFTDVDDKIINRANYEKRDPFELSAHYIKEYLRHMQDLNILPATVYPQATQEIEHIIETISALIEKGHAYAADGDVYFSVPTDEDYGKLSGRKTEDMQAGARVAVDDRKETPMDFALWKSAKEGEPSWPSPWGNGRPGWHIECSVMSLNHLGEQIDIHGGGTDLIFPHHENEIAQSECYTDKQFATYWIHNGMLQFDGEKMSKSLGNMITIDQFLKEHEANVMRMLILTSNYRHPLKYSEKILEQTEKSLERLRSALKPELPGANGMDEDSSALLANEIEVATNGFELAMDDDFNGAGALACLFDLVRVINQSRDQGATDEELKPAQDLIVKLTGVLGLELAQGGAKDAAVGPFIELLLKVRKDARDNKNWAMSDLIRDELLALGVVIEDHKEGSTWHWA